MRARARSRWRPWSGRLTADTNDRGGRFPWRDLRAFTFAAQPAKHLASRRKYDGIAELFNGLKHPRLCCWIHNGARAAASSRYGLCPRAKSRCWGLITDKLAGSETVEPSLCGRIEERRRFLRVDQLAAEPSVAVLPRAFAATC